MQWSGGGEGGGINQRSDREAIINIFTCYYIEGINIIFPFVSHLTAAKKRMGGDKSEAQQ